MYWLLEVCILLFIFTTIGSGTYSMFSSNFNRLSSSLQMQPRLFSEVVYVSLKNSVDFYEFLKFRQIFSFEGSVYEDM